MAPPIHRTIPITPPSDGDGSFLVSLLRAFGLSSNAIPIPLSGASQRLIAFIALQDRPTSRTAVATTLWPEGSNEHAHASLRSTLWRLEEHARNAMAIDALDLELASGVSVDLRDAQALAHRILLVDTAPSDADMSAAAIDVLSSELLPDWYEDWAVLKAEDWRQLRLHALEALALKLMDSHRFADGIQAARATIEADPLRESARAVLIRIHLAEGNQSEALAQFAEFRALLRDELGVEPTQALRALLPTPP